MKIKLTFIRDGRIRRPPGVINLAASQVFGTESHRMPNKTDILVVEDDALVSEVIAAALDDTYPVTIVETATEAMTILQRGSVRLMLLDCTLPGGVDPGLIPEAARLGTAVVLMSGDPGRMAKLTDQPLPFVLKPFTLTGLIETVEAVLNSSAV